MTMASPGLSRSTLHFHDPQVEARYRAEEDGKCIGLLRWAGLAGAALLLLMGIVLDVFVPASLVGSDGVLRLALVGALSLAAGSAASFLPPWQRHPQAAVALTAILFTAIMIAPLRHLPVEFVTHRGFLLMMLHLFSIHSLLRLRLLPAAVAGWLSLVVYGLELLALGTLPGVIGRHLFWLTAGNLWGTLICYQLDLSARREFMARAALDRERARAEGLLLNILPAAIAARLKDSHQPIAEHSDNVTVLFADLVGFTPLSARKTPAELVALLDRVFSGFDVIAREHGLEKIKTIGDAYMAVAGLPEPQSDHALRAARSAIAMVRAVAQAAAETGEPLQLRVGLHTGPVVAGVIGRSKFSYDLWGDTVNTASRMESLGLPDRVHCSRATAAFLDGEFALESRGEVEVKGKGPMETFLLGAA